MFLFLVQLDLFGQPSTWKSFCTCLKRKASTAADARMTAFIASFPTLPGNYKLAHSPDCTNSRKPPKSHAQIATELERFARHGPRPAVARNISGPKREASTLDRNSVLDDLADDEEPSGQGAIRGKKRRIDDDETLHQRVTTADASDSTAQVASHMAFAPETSPSNNVMAGDTTPRQPPAASQEPPSRGRSGQHAAATGSATWAGSFTSARGDAHSRASQGLARETSGNDTPRHRDGSEQQLHEGVMQQQAGLSSDAVVPSDLAAAIADGRKMAVGLLAMLCVLPIYAAGSRPHDPSSDMPKRSS